MNKFFREHLFLANKGKYAGKHDLFYPLKQQLLEKNGQPDGWDKQIIAKECWDCNGTGTDDWNDGITCYSCDGTGYYRYSVYYLQRYILGNRVYHVPTEEEKLIGSQRTTIEGFVEHSLPKDCNPRRSMMILLARYKTLVFLNILRWSFSNWVNKKTWGWSYVPFRFTVSLEDNLKILVPYIVLCGGRINHRGEILFKNIKAENHFWWLVDAHFPNMFNDVPF